MWTVVEPKHKNRCSAASVYGNDVLWSEAGVLQNQYKENNGNIIAGQQTAGVGFFPYEIIF